VRAGASLKEICEASPLEEVQEGYSACLEELVRFRTDHLVLVARFILGPRAASRRRVVEHLEQQGTGGTPLATFLKKIRDDTKPAVIGD